MWCFVPTLLKTLPTHMSTLQILQAMDIGSATCQLSMVTLGDDSHPLNFLDDVFPFVKDIPVSDERVSLIMRKSEWFRILPADTQTGFSLHLLVTLVYQSCQIEFESTPTEHDTLQLFQSSAGSSVTIGRRQTLALIELLRKSWNGPPITPMCCAFDEFILQKWAAIVLGEDVVRFRTQGSYPSGSGSTPDQWYLHHKVVPKAITLLCEITHQLLRQVTSLQDDRLKLLYGFAIAAFVQFHFVSIHPFRDGNGRLCRFLAKRILDAFIPVPVPMFDNRDAYIDSLCNGRREANHRMAPLALFNLLLSTAFETMTRLRAPQSVVCLWRNQVTSSAIEKELELPVQDTEATAVLLGRLRECLRGEVVRAPVDLRGSPPVEVVFSVLDHANPGDISIDEL
jgi:hypothetical protein